MKKVLLAAAVMFLAVLFADSSYAQEKKADKPKQETKAETVKKEDAAAKPINTVCPVSKEHIDEEGITYTYEGKTYAVCCKSCLKKFKKDPEKYISRLDENGKLK